MKKWLWIGSLIAVLAVLVGWRFVTKGKSETAMTTQSGARGNMPATVEMAEAESGTIVKAIETVGSAESPFRVQISPKSSGRIEFLEVRQGDRVKKGDVLVRIDPTEIQGQVLQQQASVAEARSRLAQAKLGSEPNAVSVRSQIEQQKAGVDSANAEYTQVQRSIDSQIASADAAVSEARSKVTSADALVANARAEVDRQLANLDNVQTKLKRTENLYKQGFIAAQDVDDMRTAVELQKKTVDVARGQLASALANFSAAQYQLKSQENQASIVRRKAQADLAAAKAKATQARASLNVAGANQAQTSAYKENVAALQSSLAAAEAQLSQARARLAETTLRSPIDGIVTARNADPGALASPSQSILVVQSVGWLYVSTSLPSEQVAAVHIGQEANVRFDALPDKDFNAKISNINPAADDQSRQFVVLLKLVNTSGEIKPGMFGKVSIISETVNADVLVPKEAIKPGQGGKNTVAVVNSEFKAEIRDVTLGASDGKFVQVLSGVKAGEKVVTLSFQPVRDGQQIKKPGEKPKQGGKP